MKKALFFDIDGTLWDRTNHIAESTVQAMKKLKENGHLIFLNSGRCKSYITHPNLLAMDFDGIIAGCGTMVEFHGEELFYHQIPVEQVNRDVKLMLECGFAVIVEGKHYIYMNPSDMKDEAYGKKLERELGQRLKPLKDGWDRWEASKYDVLMGTPRQDECLEILSRDYTVMSQNPFVAEIVPAGMDKGTGIRTICEKLGIAPEDTFAFGDSPNDLGMLAAAGTGIVMGNGHPEAKKAADYVTTALDADGIYKACEYFGLI